MVETNAAVQSEQGQGHSSKIMEDLLSKSDFKIPQVGDNLDGKVIEQAKNYVLIDFGPYGVGIVRGKDLWESLDSYSDIKIGDSVTATVMEQENEEGMLEMSFKQASREKAWGDLKAKLADGIIFPVRVKEANRGGLIASVNGIPAFLPVSQLASEHYPRVEGGSVDKILTKLQEYIGEEMEVKVIASDPVEEKLIISEKEARFEKQKDKMGGIKVGDIINGVASGIVDFGVFVKFDHPDSGASNLEGLVHISELAWQRIEDPADIVKLGEKVQAKIIGIDGTKISLSVKKMQRDPWLDAVKDYKVGQVVAGKVSEVTPFGAFVQLSNDIHGLVHISEISSKKVNDPREFVKAGDKMDFKILSIEPAEHRLGLSLRALQEKEVKKESKKEAEVKGAKKDEPVKKAKKEEPTKEKKVKKAKK